MTATELPLEEVDKEDGRPMTAADIRSALRKRWPDSEYITIEEAPDGPDRQGRKIDMLAISLWRSRGYELDAVEVKVSLSDWTREVNEAAKADFWWRHSHRFWVGARSTSHAMVTCCWQLPTRLLHRLLPAV